MHATRAHFCADKKCDQFWSLQIPLAYLTFFSLRSKAVGGKLITHLLHNGNPLQYSCLENPMDRGAWKAAVHGVAKSRTQLSNLHFHFSAFTYPKSKAGYSNPITTQLIISLLLIIIFLSSSIDEFMGYFIFLPYQAELV